LKKYLIVSWWIWPRPRDVRVTSEAEDIDIEDDSIENLSKIVQKRKKRLGQKSRVVIAKPVIDSIDYKAGKEN